VDKSRENTAGANTNVTATSIIEVRLLSFSLLNKTGLKGTCTKLWVVHYLDSQISAKMVKHCYIDFADSYA
jgi:hypothetical protein